MPVNLCIIIGRTDDPPKTVKRDVYEKDQTLSRCDAGSADCADGDCGSATEEAVKGFQLGNDLAATGVIEQTTYDTLFSDSAVAAAKEEPATPDKDDDSAADTAKTSNAPAESGVKAPASTPTAPNTDVEVKTAELSSKSVAAVAESPLFKQSANGTNFEFIIWLGIMIVVMLIAFTIVYVVEKKKQKANQGRRYQ